MYKRHDLVWLTPQGWETALRGLAGAPRELAQHWCTRGLPAVVRRLEPGTPPALLCLGIPAPPDAHSGQKVRLGFAVERRHVAEVRPALALDNADALTGDRYLGAGSDVDLLLRPLDGAQLDAGLALIARHAQSLPLDGEIEFPSGHAVSWKEWLGVEKQQGADRVLAKHLDTVALLRRDELLGQFGTIEGRHG
jgi:phosphoribosyl-dephospho-CoA transferase